MSKFNVKDILTNYLGRTIVPYPGAFFSDAPNYKNNTNYRHNHVEPNYTNGADYQYQETAYEKTRSSMGSTLRKKDAQGRWYFMPIEINGVELQNTVVAIQGKKTIVETAMVGRKGTVKELISVDDYEISVAGVIADKDFPDVQIAELNDLYNINEAVTLKCALTDIFLNDDDKVVIKSIELGQMQGVETAQTFKMSLVSDRSFELIIE